MPNEFYNDMGQRIYKLRKQLRLTQEELASKAGLSHQVCSTAERGSKALKAENVVKIARALEVSTDYLLAGKLPSADNLNLNDSISKLNHRDFLYISKMITLFLEYNGNN